jgi:hypothetical protein
MREELWSKSSAQIYAPLLLAVCHRYQGEYMRSLYSQESREFLKCGSDIFKIDLPVPAAPVLL